MTTHEFNNDSNQTERRRVERDTYLSRAQAEADQVGGRFKKEVTTTVNAVPTYPSLPSSSPFAKGFDEVVGVEPPLGYAVDEVPAQSNLEEPALSPTTVVASPADVGDALARASR